MLLLRQAGLAVLWVGFAYLSFSEGKRWEGWMSSLRLRLILLLGAYAFLLFLLETKVGQFLATLTDASPLDDSPAFAWSFGWFGRAIFVFVLMILPTLTGVLVSEWVKKPENV